MFFIAAEMSGLADPPLQRQIAFWLSAVVLITSTRALARAFCRRTVAYLQNTVIVGAGDVGQLVAHKFGQHPEYGINLARLRRREPEREATGLESRRILGPDQLPELVRVLDVERVVFAFSEDSHEELLDLIRSIKDMGVQIDIVPRLFEVLGTNVGIDTAEGLPLMGLPPLRLTRSAMYSKRVLDLAFSLLCLVPLVPLFGLIAVLIKVDSPGPVFFRQVRRGADETEFRIFKFRTMSADAELRKSEVASLNKHLSEGGDPRMFKIPDDPRITRVGRLLRRTRSTSCRSSATSCAAR